MSKRWAPRNDPDTAGRPDPARMADMAARLQVSPLLVGILWDRGLRELEAMDVFLSPGLRHLAQPNAWPGLREAAAVLAQGLNPPEGGAQKRMAVWGDYDVDGVTATALVIDFLAQHGIAALHHLPVRGEEGYGLNPEGIEALAAQGVQLLLTVDCGIGDHAAIARARELGMDVVVSDHHLPGPQLPPANAVCNPRLAQCPCPDLAGVGVAFFLMAALNRLLPAPKNGGAGGGVDMRQFLDLVALGTLADVVALEGQNRILTKNGLLLIASAARPGIAALKREAGYDMSAALGASQVVFGLAPRINAAGRMGQAETALRLLLAPDLQQALPLAAQLGELNRLRREEEDRILQAALDQAHAQQDRLGLVLYAPDWHEGVIGIVASRVVEDTNRPTLILTQTEDGLLKGSGRSIPEFDLHHGISQCADILVGFGGHRQAAGLRLRLEQLDELRARFHEAARAQLGDEPLPPRQAVDAELGFGQIDFTLLKELELLQPFGMGNPEPVFVSPPLLVAGRRPFGRDNAHVTLELRDIAAGVTLRAKAWRQAKELPRDMEGKTIRIAFTPRIDRYNGLATIDLRLRDWQWAENP